MTILAELQSAENEALQSGPAEYCYDTTYSLSGSACSNNPARLT
jgi:hypothetical protein